MDIKSLFKNRWVLAFICLTLSVILIYTTSVNKNNEYTKVIQVISSIQKGRIITKENIKEISVSGYNLPSNLIKQEEDIIGKYALADFSVGDFILSNKVGSELSQIDYKMSNLDGSKVSISIAISDFAKGMSDKIIAGDIVSCIIVSDEEAIIPKELNFVEVITTTTPEGVDKTRTDDYTESNLATATLLVTPEQAKMLANYNQNSIIHLALVFRGDDSIKETFLQKQSELLTGKSSTTDNEVNISLEDSKSDNSYFGIIDNTLNNIGGHLNG